jgi:DNA-binding MarR family transcriptional regulator
MTPREARVGKSIFRGGGTTGGELADQLGVARSATSQIAAKPASRGLVEERPIPADAKRKHLYVTERGRVVGQVAMEYQSPTGRALFGEISRTEAKACVRIVERLEV